MSKEGEYKCNTYRKREWLVLILKVQKVENRKNLFLLLKKKREIEEEKERQNFFFHENHEKKENEEKCDIERKW